jgi:hypothetical protein
MSLLSNLFKYRQREGLTPLENFLTEALCHFCRLVAEADHESYSNSLSREMMQNLFQVTAPEDIRDLVWSTQYRLASASDPGVHGLIPDLMGEARTSKGTFIVLVECKVSAGYTQREDEAGRWSSQLALYERYLQSRGGTVGELVLLTHLSPKPQDWNGKRVTWRGVSAALEPWCFSENCHRYPVVKAYALELLKFLQENGMGKITLDINDIASYPPWRRLEAACDNLGRMLQFYEGSPLQRLMEESGLYPPHARSLEYPRSQKFFGDLVLTAQEGEATRGVGLNDCKLFLWIGVAMQELYSAIQPTVDGVPDFHAGMALFPNKWQVEVDGVYDRFQRIKQTLGNAWSLKRVDDPNDKEGSIIVISKRQCFLTLLEDERDWGSKQKEFFDQTATEWLRVPSEEWQYLAQWQKEINPSE